jgi:lysophospholipase L1-like esterase
VIDRRTLIALGVLVPVGAAGTYAFSRYLEDRRFQREQQEDWAGLRHHAADNRRLMLSGARTNIVFLGDSITAYWRTLRPGFFSQGRVDRGIPGQTSSQILLRVMQDVVQLKPRFLHLMAGINDFTGITGPMTVPQIADNLRAIIDIARANGIEVLLASQVPAARFPWRPDFDPVKPIAELNAWCAAHAQALGVTWVDYRPVLTDAAGAVKPGITRDGVHPNEEGYRMMESVIEPLLKARGV